MKHRSKKSKPKRDGLKKTNPPKTFKQKRHRQKQTKQFVDEIVSQYQIFSTACLENTFSANSRINSFLKSLDHHLFVDSISKFYSDIRVDVNSLISFEQFPLSLATKKGLTDGNFIKPTEIQQRSVSHALLGADVVGTAKTGSGKTLALLIPLLECLWRQQWSRTSDGLGALIISPTRELAFQTFNVLNKIGAHHQFSVALLIGGTDVEFERKRVGSVNIIVCTPGRLLQHMDENPNFTCEHLQMLVIDEADRIFDLGFSRQMKAILDFIPNERQTLLFSATLSKEITELTHLALRNPIFISAYQNASETTPDNLKQSYFVCRDDEKVNMLWSFLIDNKRKKTIIFVSCCKQARFLTDAFCHLRPGLSLMGLWGTMNQTKRFEIFNRFNNKPSSVALIATDVASRGLDFSRVDCVLQLDCPADVNDYIHRVGRTARMDAKGEAVLALTPSQEEQMVKHLASQNISITKICVDPSKIFEISKRLQSTVVQYPNMKEFAQRCFVTYIRTIYLMKDKRIFNVESIDFLAFAKSYGLEVAPRVRFLKRAAARKAANRNEKTADELLNMILSSSKKKQDNNCVNVETNTVAENSGTELDVATRRYDDNDAFDDSDAEEGSEIELKCSKSKNDFELESDDDDGILKLSRKDVFEVLPDREKMVNLCSEPNVSTKSMNRIITKQAMAKKMLRKGIRVNVKKVFADDDVEMIGEEKLVNSECSNNNESNRSENSMALFDINEAKQELRKADESDRIAYKEKQRKWRKEKKEKLKKKVTKKKREEGGAILDLGEGDADDEPDLSWLPDPDKPKKYDDDWNEIKEVEHMAEPYKPPSKHLSERLDKRISLDILYWRRFKNLAVFQEPGNVTSTTFSPTNDKIVASTSSVRLTIFDTTVCEPMALFARFKQAVFGVRFRQDGRLMAVGGQEGKVYVFDVQKHAKSSDGPKVPLRIMKSHKCPVHVVLFICSGRMLVAMGDDGAIKMFEIVETNAAPKKVIEKAHSDHIRCGDSSVVSEHLFVSGNILNDLNHYLASAKGSYDHTAKVWDARSDSENEMLTVNHESPVEQVILLPGDAFLATAGGEFIKIWNLISGGTQVHTLHCHHKTVTSLALASKGTRLLSGGLDRKINVFSLNSGDFKLLHSYKVSAQVLTLSVSCNDQFIAFGENNILEIYVRGSPGILERSLAAAASEKAGLEFRKSQRVAAPPSRQRQRGGEFAKVELTAAPVGQPKLDKINALLRQFKHWKALDMIFRQKHYTLRPEIVVATLTQIYKRKALEVALSGRQADTICPILLFLIKNCTKPEYSAILMRTTNVMCDIYGSLELQPQVAKMFAKLQRAIQREIEICKKICEVRGMLNLIVFKSDTDFATRMDGTAEEIFGEVVVTPKPFSLSVNGDATSEATIESMQDN